MAVLRNVMLRSELLSHSANSFFKIGSEELAVYKERVGFKKIL